jgi:glycosyltransferase involved in cell wall biosynthesis
MNTSERKTLAMREPQSPSPTDTSRDETAIRVGLLTGADDRSYALGLATSLMARGIRMDFVGSDQVDGPELHGTPLVDFLNLRGEQSTDASPWQKALRVSRYYVRLMAYAARSPAKVFHILWNNKFQHFDRTLLMLYYRLLGHRVVLTAHNVNAAKRDGHDSPLNRFTLRIQYGLCSHIFVHTPRMRDELQADFGIEGRRISVIPFGINNTSPVTNLDRPQARQRLGLNGSGQRVMLCFGQIAPYKGLEYLAAALPKAFAADPMLQLVIAGKVKAGCEDYWRSIERALDDAAIAPRVIKRIEHIPDSDVEVYFKAADVLVIPYVHIFQSGVPFLAYSFGLPVVATDVGALRDDIVEGRTGFICRPRDSADLARTIALFFDSALFAQGNRSRQQIRDYANDRYSWARVAAITESVYRCVQAER